MPVPSARRMPGKRGRRGEQLVAGLSRGKKKERTRGKGNRYRENREQRGQVVLMREKKSNLRRAASKRSAREKRNGS